MPNDSFNLENIKLKDIIDLDFLQKFQDDFGESMEIASITVNMDGVPITKPTRYTNFCSKYTQSNEKGIKKCAESHRIGGEEAARTGKPYIYTCHAGLIDFAVPIIIDGKQFGTILGGQIVFSKVDEEKILKTASELGLDSEKYKEEANKITSLAENKVKAAANILFTVVNALSQIGHQQLKIKEMTNILSENFSQISAAMEELAASSVQVAENQESLNNEILNVDKLSNEINSILTYIKDIANQTKMLGLNASIEAARAGDAGKGFGVVANEIRKLSETSKETAAKISALTEKIQNSVHVTLDTSDATLNTTQQQSAAVQETNASVEEIMSLADELNSLANK
ncbi:PocR ligand-binding domain-containing protein [Clostridium guangxiense]|uniref:PocR ligand-binding domain-containing protein n=1 Tax=Clostridium guangxiense TaxID=1662055 RepID=UPI001E3D9057|nr:PocR ligand-binding domain-containing protein [Clostridium guangxiense]MCD2346615.1 PocR ligand-binding domain-containing protein [Clostridium guangxiense]